MNLAPEDLDRLKKIDRLALIGAGKMGMALLDLWLVRGLNPKNVSVFEPEPSAELSALAPRGLQINPPQNHAPYSVVILSVKPQIASELLPTLAAMLSGHTLVVSIMAGRTLSFLEAAMPGPSIVRAMPNLPAAIGCGITVAIANKRVNETQRAVANALLAATGQIDWIGDESLIDAVTALSGTGPAYVFLLVETLTQAGIEAGLPKELSQRLARATVAGAGELLDRSPLDAATLRNNVTSPGGTTAAAMDVLIGADGLEPLMIKAVKAAAKRARQLAG